MQRLVAPAAAASAAATTVTASASAATPAATSALCVYTATPPSSPTARELSSVLAREGLLLYLVNHFVRHSQVLDGVAPDVALCHPPETIAVLRGADDLTQVNVHPGVAAHQVAVVGFPILELYQLQLSNTTTNDSAPLSTAWTFKGVGVCYSVGVRHTIGWPCAVLRSERGNMLAV